MQNLCSVGKSVPKLDAVDKATGRAQYIQDLKLPGMLYGKLLRSPLPHARIRAIDTRKAEAMPGVVAILTGADLMDSDPYWGHAIKDRPIVAIDVVRHVGEPVAAVAAVHEVHPGEDLNGNGRVDEEDWNGLDDDGNGYVDDLVGFDFANSIDANGDGDYTDPGDTNDPDPFDDNGHGTHVAGIVAAERQPGSSGVVGMAPLARLVPMKIIAAAVVTRLRKFAAPRAPKTVLLPPPPSAAPRSCGRDARESFRRSRPPTSSSRPLRRNSSDTVTTSTGPEVV